MNELDEVSNKILNLSKMGYCIVALKLNDKLKRVLIEANYPKSVVNNSKYYIYNTMFGLNSGSFVDELYKENIKPDYIIEL